MDRYCRKAVGEAVKALSNKIVKPVLTLVKRKRHSKRSASHKKLQQSCEEEITTIWQHPSDLSNETNENTANELLEARLHELIVRECAAVAAQTGAPLSVHVSGHFTVTPYIAALPVPVCIVEPSTITSFQKAEGQAKISNGTVGN
ncbi:uncharacterized protein LOC136026971 [Artemia franciscana]|uniref:Uncharacterized protein n=1 Tax=Artemia franciscana TaxID=6661 RepID=A0AA88KW46_ARTSF|nr:hypothetical protein QYM36_013205 [Artemia franciscana]